MEDRPKVGVAVILLKNGKVLLGKRKSKLGKGSWGPPGGHMEFNETPEECARREISEETGITVRSMKFLKYTNYVFEKERKHYVTLYFVSDDFVGEPRTMEPSKLEMWGWFETGNLPSPLFSTFKDLMKEDNPFKQGSSI